VGARGLWISKYPIPTLALPLKGRKYPNNFEVLL